MRRLRSLWVARFGRLTIARSTPSRCLGSAASAAAGARDEPDGIPSIRCGSTSSRSLKERQLARRPCPETSAASNVVQPAPASLARPAACLNMRPKPRTAPCHTQFDRSIPSRSRMAARFSGIAPRLSRCSSRPVQSSSMMYFRVSIGQKPPSLVYSATHASISTTRRA